MLNRNARTRMKSTAALAIAIITMLFTTTGCRYTPQPVSGTNPNIANAQGNTGTAPANGSRRPARSVANRQATPGTFDFYLLNLSWSPEFCATHGASPECGHGLGFVVHGLWPQDTNGTYPEDCSHAPGPTDPQSYTDLIPTVSLIAHEWQTHGTCTGLQADDYFAEIRKAFQAVKIPAGVGTNGDTNGVTPDQLLARFASANPGYPAGSIALSCGNNRLTAVEICLGKNLAPEACQGVRSCGANSIKITPQ